MNLTPLIPKYTLGTQLRYKSRHIVGLIMTWNLVRRSI